MKLKLILACLIVPIFVAGCEKEKPETASKLVFSVEKDTHDVVKDGNSMDIALTVNDSKALYYINVYKKNHAGNNVFSKVTPDNFENNVYKFNYTVTDDDDELFTFRFVAYDNRGNSVTRTLTVDSRTDKLDIKDQFMELTVKQSLNLAGKHMIGMLNLDDNYLPYWLMFINPDYSAGLLNGWPAHNLGRWLDAMTRLNDATGFKLPSDIMAKMEENVEAFFDNPDNINFNPNPDPFLNMVPRPMWDLHSLREGLLALMAIYKYQGSAWARDKGIAMINSINEKLNDDGTWNFPKFYLYQQYGNGYPSVTHNFHPCDTHGRFLEALVWFYELTGSQEAYNLAERIAKWHFVNITSPDGTIRDQSYHWVDHTHSYFGTLRGLLLWGKLTNDNAYIDRVIATYRTTIPKYVKQSGYNSHNMINESFGETASAGDAAQMALWLWEMGYPEFIDDVDRIVRSRILPAQVLKTQRLFPVSTPGNPDASRELEERMIGAIGGCHGHPHGGKCPVNDVTCSGIHTLADVYKHIAFMHEGAMTVLLHFDYEDQDIKVDVTRESTGKLEVTMKKAGKLRIRIPGWVPAESLSYTSGETPASPQVSDNMADFGNVAQGAVITMNYALPEKTTTETDLGVTYSIKWKGDQVLGATPNTSFYPFYRDL